MDTFFELQKVTKAKWRKNININRPVSIKVIKLLAKNLPKKKTTYQENFTGEV